MAEALGHDVDRFAVLEQQRGMHVPQVVEPDRRFTRRNVARISSPGRSVRRGVPISIRNTRSPVGHEAPTSYRSFAWRSACSRRTPTVPGSRLTRRTRPVLVVPSTRRPLRRLRMR